MFEDLSGHQLTQLEKVWKAALNATSWRDSLRSEISRALATGCTLHHVAAATGLDYETIERLRREPRHDFAGRHPTDPTHPDRTLLPVTPIDAPMCCQGASGGAGRPVMGHSLRAGSY